MDDAISFTIRIRKHEFDALVEIAKRKECSVKTVARRAVQRCIFQAQMENERREAETHATLTS
jgi:hypothetical protein